MGRVSHVFHSSLEFRLILHQTVLMVPAAALVLREQYMAAPIQMEYAHLSLKPLSPHPRMVRLRKRCILMLRLDFSISSELLLKQILFEVLYIVVSIPYLLYLSP